jgi:hypothetical protein
MANVNALRNDRELGFKIILRLALVFCKMPQAPQALDEPQPRENRSNSPAIVRACLHAT